VRHDLFFCEFLLPAYKSSSKNLSSSALTASCFAFFPLGKATFVIPSDLAYGDAGSGPVIPPGATLKFEVELFKVLDLDADADDLQGGETEVIELPDGTKMRVPKGVKMRLVDEEE
jgi:hypothetical protein